MNRIITAVALIAGAVVAGSAAAQTAPARNPAGSLKPGQTFKECRNCPEMVVVPSGAFVMGSPADEPERRENEPQVRVTFRRPFAMSRTEVTWDQWEACVRDRWCDGPGVEQGLRTNEDATPNKAFVDWGRGSRPVVGVSWFDAQHFVGWLNWTTGQDDTVSVGREARSQLRQLRRCRPGPGRQGGGTGCVDRPDRAGRLVPAERLRAA
jgi:formylglycine-generating enzyme required for sulfatase activity